MKLSDRSYADITVSFRINAIADMSKKDMQRAMDEWIKLQIENWNTYSRYRVIDSKVAIKRNENLDVFRTRRRRQ